MGVARIDVRVVRRHHDRGTVLIRSTGNRQHHRTVVLAGDRDRYRRRRAAAVPVVHRIGEGVGRSLSHRQIFERTVRRISERAVVVVRDRALRPGRVHREGVGVARIDVRVVRRHHDRGTVLIRSTGNRQHHRTVVLAGDRDDEITGDTVTVAVHNRIGNGQRRRFASSQRIKSRGRGDRKFEAVRARRHNGKGRNGNRNAVGTDNRGCADVDRDVAQTVSTRIELRARTVDRKDDAGRILSHVARDVARYRHVIVEYDVQYARRFRAVAVAHDERQRDRKTIAAGTGVIERTEKSCRESPGLRVRNLEYQNRVAVDAAGQREGRLIPGKNNRHATGSVSGQR